MFIFADSNETTTFVPVMSTAPSPTPNEQGIPPQPERFPPLLETCPLNDAAYCVASAAIAEAGQQQAVAGMPLSQALVTKGLACSAAECNPGRSSVFVPHPYNQKGYLHDALSEMYDCPKNNTLAPPSLRGTFSTTPPMDVPGIYDKPRCWTTADLTVPPVSQDRALTLSNGYMVPKLSQLHTSQRNPNYDYPPPPRPLEMTAATGQHHSALTQASSADHPTPRKSADDPVIGDYVNFHPSLGDLPPPIDRSTKPCPPKVDRSTKPDRRNSTGQQYVASLPNDTPSSSSTPSASSHNSYASSVSSEFEEPFSASDIPRPFHHSVQYTQVSFLPLQQAGPAQQQPQLVLSKLSESQLYPEQQQNKKPVPAPRSKSPRTPRNLPNYTQIDLVATNAYRLPAERGDQYKRQSLMTSQLYDMEESSTDSEVESDEGYLRMTVS